MDSRKDMTKRLIADGFKALMLRYPFEKISIMMITNEAGIRRPSFYNHFQDKYDLLAWIVETDVIAPAGEPLRRGDGVGALRTIFAGLVEDAAFYSKAFCNFYLMPISIPYLAQFVLRNFDVSLRFC